jgi:D-alanine-D-alanine ligase
MVIIALIAGGRSGEFDISLKSGGAVSAALGRLGHEVRQFVITQEGTATYEGQAMSLAEAFRELETGHIDCAFIAMHGEDGEDGRIQGALDLLGIPYQGCGVRASAIAIDKALTKLHYRHAGLPVANDITLRHGDSADWDTIASTLGLPLVLKTAKSGSSVGIELVETLENLSRTGAELLASTTSLVIEAWLPGREFTGAVLENPDGSLSALPIVEICPTSARFFDYEAKYTPGATDELCPAPIPEEFADALKQLALQAHRALGCCHISRTDFKCDGDNQPFLLETNSLPGLTPMSLLPKAAEAHGLGFDGLIDALVQLAIRDQTPR